MKKLLSFICILSVLATLGLQGISAMRAPIVFGNVDLAEDRNIKDVTLLQKYLADICSLTPLQELIADTDGDGKITIRDATLIQKDIADIARIEENSFFPYMGLHYLYPDYLSGKAMVGVPVTFYASAFAYDDRSYPLTYEFYVNDELVQERSEQSTFTYTFEEKGSYNITGKIYSKYGYSEEIYGYRNYMVTEPYESEAPVIKSIYCTEQTSCEPLYEIYEEETELKFIAEAICGSGEYEYAFWLNDTLIKDFSDDNTCTCTFSEPYGYYLEYFTLRVFAKNKGTDVSSSETYTFGISSPMP